MEPTDDQGRKISLGKQVGQPGGEGIAYSIANNAGLIAKIYHPHLLPSESQVAKLEAQLKLTQPDLLEYAAWPQSILRHNQKVVGFLMPKASGKSIHLLYRPVDRNSHFPSATWKSLIDVAKNAAAAFHRLHSHDVIMGDVNETNILVCPKTGKVRFIDCDSFQFRSLDGKIFPCNVFTPGWASPEFLEASEFSAPRTFQHDLFGLAVLIFHLLFMGRHPFAGVPPKELLENPPPLEEQIVNFEFPYSISRASRFSPPPSFLTLSELPPTTAGLFERAFLTRDRPTASEWFFELDRIDVNSCRWGHVYYRRLKECPWCTIWNRGGGNFFVVLSSGFNLESSQLEIESLLANVNCAVAPTLDSIMANIERIRPFSFNSPNLATLPIPKFSPAPFPKIPKGRIGWIFGAALVASSLFLILSGFIAIALITFIIGAVLIYPGTSNPAYNKEIQKILLRPEITMAELSKVSLSIEELAKNSSREFLESINQATQKISFAHSTLIEEFESRRREIFHELSIIQNGLRQLPSLGDSLRSKILQSSQEEDYLRRIRIPPSGIRQIGPVRFEILKSYGVFTAWDVRQMRWVPGLGPGAAELKIWLRRVESKFRFNAKMPLSKSAEQEVRKEVQKREQELLSKFRNIQRLWHDVKRTVDEFQVEMQMRSLVANEIRRIESLRVVTESKFSELKMSLDDAINQHGRALADAGGCPRPLGKWD